MGTVTDDTSTTMTSRLQGKQTMWIYWRGLNHSHDTTDKPPLAESPGTAQAL